MNTKNRLQTLLRMGGLLPATLLFAVGFSACEASWDDHYHTTETKMNNTQVSIVSVTTEAYLQDQDSLSGMYAFLRDQGILEQINAKDQLHTLFLVDDATFAQEDTTNASFLAKSLVTDIALSPSNLYDGERILMWHGKYVVVSLDSAALAGNISHIRFNEVPVKEIIKTSDGYIYVLEHLIKTPMSLYDVINNLGDDYSLFKEMVMAKNVLTFDKPNSKPIGVDNTGNTVYDSVFIISNPFFDAKGFDLTAESLTATVMLPSNEVIRGAMDDAKAKLTEWDMTRDTNLMKNWILEVAFFNQRYTPADLSANTDISSIYGRQWRTTVQLLDTENPISMSNGIAYKVTWMKIPNNILMYRLKDYFYYYENCSETQKAAYFNATNLEFKECVTDVAGWTPLPGVWPNIENRVLTYSFINTEVDVFNLEFVPIKRVANSEGGYDIRPWKIPPGEYTLGMGFKQSLGLDVEISFNDVSMGTFTLGSATTFHYDRGAGSYAEGYREALDTPGLITHSKKGNYDRDGGQIGTVVVTGDAQGNPAPVKLSIGSPGFGTATKMIFHHWCLRPTNNNY